MRVLKALFLVGFLSLGLSACGGGGESEALVQNQAPTPPPVSDTADTVPDIIPPVIVEPEILKLSAVISWDIPERRLNGERLSLSDIGGYEILYRSTNQDNYETITVVNQNASEFVLEGIEPGEYEFMIASFDSEGVFSDFSSPSIVQLN